MNALVTRLNAWFGPAQSAIVKGLVLPAFVVMMLAMMVLPLPAFVLDLLFTFNIALALTVMMVSAQMVKPLDVPGLPTVLLVTTLLRLSLNVASTRVVLMDGHTGPGAAGAVWYCGRGLAGRGELAGETAGQEIYDGQTVCCYLLAPIA